MKFFVGIILALFVSTLASAETLMTTKQFLKSNLSKGMKLSREKFKLNDQQLKHLSGIAENADDQSATFYFFRTDGNLKQSCTVVPQAGKEGPLKIGVCFDQAGVTSAVELLDFSEDRGQKAREKSFLKQFKNRSKLEEVRVGHGITAVVGATYTSEAISEAIRKSMQFYNWFVKGKK